MRIQMRRRDTAAIAVLTLMLTGMFGRSLADDAGWPQWLGPTRNAIAADGPKLLDSWPTNGPALVWRSEILGAAGGDGFSSVIVSGGKVFIYLNSKPPSNNGVPDDFLKAWGWADGVPDELAKKVEAARLSEKRTKIRGGVLHFRPIPQMFASPELDAYIQESLAALDPKDVEQFGDFIRTRLNLGEGGFSGEAMTNLAASRGKQIKSAADFRALFGYVHGHSALNEVISGESLTLFQCLDVMVCLDAATGKELWRKSLPGRASDGGYAGMDKNGVSSTPAVWADKVYFLGSAAMYCLSAKDGRLIWQTKTDFTDSSPLILNGALYCINGMALSAYNAETGRLLWRQYKTVQDPRFWGTSRSVAVWTHDGKSYLIGAGGAALWCVEPERGEMVWSFKGKGESLVQSTPIISGDLAAVLSDHAAMYKLSPQKAELLWETHGGDRGGSALIYRDSVYFGGNHLPGIQCMDVKTGEIKWKAQHAATESVTPVAADGKIFFNTGEPGVIMFRATQEKFDKLGEMAAGDQVTICTTPAIANGRMYLHERSRVSCYDLAGSAK
jgi:outer membrane protein assembly factor BamB